MPSGVFTDSQRQLTLALDEGLLSRYRNLRECIAQGVYQRGLTWVAGQLNKSPGNLSSELGDESQRKFGVDELEEYISRTGDKTPVYYLVARFLGDEGAARDMALRQVADMLAQLPAALAAAGMAPMAPATVAPKRGAAR